MQFRRFGLGLPEQIGARLIPFPAGLTDRFTVIGIVSDKNLIVKTNRKGYLRAYSEKANDETSEFRRMVISFKFLENMEYTKRPLVRANAVKLTHNGHVLFAAIHHTLPLIRALP